MRKAGSASELVQIKNTHSVLCFYSILLRENLRVDLQWGCSICVYINYYVIKCTSYNERQQKKYTNVLNKWGWIDLIFFMRKLVGDVRCLRNLTVISINKICICRKIWRKGDVTDVYYNDWTFGYSGKYYLLWTNLVHNWWWWWGCFKISSIYVKMWVSQCEGYVKICQEKEKLQRFGPTGTQFNEF